MAQLFDPRRFEPLNTRIFNPVIQLPMISDLNGTERQQMALAELHELTAPFIELSDGEVQDSANADPFEVARFQASLRSLHLQILDALVADHARLSSYHLGIALSDLCWKHDPGGNWVSTFLSAFERGELAELQVLLRTASESLPGLAAATVSKSLENWQDWADINARMLRKNGVAGQLAAPVLRGLRIQGDIWHQLLTVETVGEKEEGPALTVFAALRRIRVILIVAVLTAIALYLTIVNFGGAAKVWTAIGTITAALGVTGASLVSATRKAANAFGWNQQTTAKAEARVWSVTMLPAVPLTASQRYRLDRRGVRYATVRANLDG